MIVDSAMKPWLLEVNSSPALSMDNNTDHAVKPDLIKDIFNIIQFESYDQFTVRFLIVYHFLINPFLI